MLTGFRRRKLKKLFDVTDVNKNGVIERGDYVMVLDNLCRRKGWGPESDEYRHLRELLRVNWKSVQFNADANRDGVVTLEEWYAAWDGFYGSLGGETFEDFPEWFRDFTDMLFDSLDLDGDGRISRADYATFLEAHGLEEDVDEVFGHLDLDGDGFLTREEAERLAAQFHLSEDQEAPGRWLYGHLPD